MLTRSRTSVKVKKRYIIFQHKIALLSFQKLILLIFISLKEQLLGEKMQYIKRDQVKVSAVPQIEGLSVHNVIDYALQKPFILNYLPDQRDWLHIDRHWLCDLIFTLDNENFQRFIENAMKQRKEKLEENRNLQIQIRPEFFAALEKCLNFSHEKGKSVSLLKESSKRKRKRNEIEDVKEEELKLKEDKQIYLVETKRLRVEKQQLEEEVNQLRLITEELIQFPPPDDVEIEQQQFRI